MNERTNEQMKHGVLTYLLTGLSTSYSDDGDEILTDCRVGYIADRLLCGIFSPPFLPLMSSPLILVLSLFIGPGVLFTFPVLID